jgi:hypothetical protein
MLEEIQRRTDEKWNRLLKKCNVTVPAQAK